MFQTRHESAGPFNSSAFSFKWDHTSGMTFIFQWSRYADEDVSEKKKDEKKSSD